MNHAAVRITGSNATIKEISMFRMCKCPVYTPAFIVILLQRYNSILLGVVLGRSDINSEILKTTVF